METSQALIIGCGVLLGAAVVCTAAWRNARFDGPPAPSAMGPGDVARRYIWYVAIAITAGVLVGISVIGCGGRLVMRLLAVTSSEAAQGRITEAEEVVGRITTDGTIGFILFIGIVGGVGLALIYLLIRRLLPAGIVGGLIYGAGLIVVFGPTVDPLRRNNPDFDIVGPGWLAVAAYVTLALMFGAALAVFVARLSEWLPLIRRERSVLVRYAGPAAVALFAYSVTAVLAIFGLFVVLGSRWQAAIDSMKSPRLIAIGRALLIAIAAVATPNAAIAFVDIASR
jgi:hypothetical protein